MADLILVPAGGGTPGGSNTNLQYNNAGAFGGFADGTAHQLLHGARTFGAVDLTQEVSGVLPGANGGVSALNGSPTAYLLPYGLFGTAAAADAASGAANLAFIAPFTMDSYLTFTKATVYIDATSSGNHGYIAVYRLSDLSKVCQLTFTCGAGTGALVASAVSPSSVTLKPDTYLLSWGADNSAIMFLGYQAFGAKAATLINNSNVLTGNKASVISSGSFPDPLPALSGFTKGASSPPIVLVEP